MAPSAVRPLAHLTAPRGWINDPLGLTAHDGRYHLFFQHVPDSTEWAPECRWGHAVSDDLVTWEHRPIALEPGDGDDGIWSGSIAIDEDGEARLYYTSVQVPDFGIGTIREARPVDRTWDTWDKGEVIATLPPELDAIAFRDPFVLRDRGTWRMLVGTALADGTAAAASFSSPDRTAWTYDGLAAQRPTTATAPVWTGTLWECPQVFEIDGSHVLVTSVWDADALHHVAYAVGEYAEGRFVPHTWNQLTFGPGYYAPSFFRDDEGRPCLIFWIRGARDEDAGWTSALSIPHLLHLDGDRLHAEPHPGARRRVPEIAAEHPQRPLELKDWDPTRQELLVTDPTGVETVLRSVEGGIKATGPDGSQTIPCETGAPAEYLLDGPVLEVFLGTASFALGAGGDLVVELRDRR